MTVHIKAKQGKKSKEKISALDDKKRRLAERELILAGNLQINKSLKKAFKKKQKLHKKSGMYKL